MEFKVDYDALDDAALNVNDFKTKIDKLKENISQTKAKISDVNIFSGPICDATIEEFNNKDGIFDAQTSIYGYMSGSLVNACNSYKEGDQNAAQTIMETFPDSLSSSVRKATSTISKEAEAMIDKAMSVRDAAYSESGYVWTGDVSTSKFTCSGLIDFALGNPPHTNTPQSLSDHIIQSGNFKRDVSKLEKGDLVFYYYTNACAPNCEGVMCGHVGIYLGDGTVIDASTERGTNNNGVKIRDVNWMPVYGGGSYF